MNRLLHILLYLIMSHTRSLVIHQVVLQLVYQNVAFQDEARIWQRVTLFHASMIAPLSAPQRVAYPTKVHVPFWLRTLAYQQWQSVKYFVSGDRNCDLFKNPTENHTKHLVFSCETHQLGQVIDKPTRVRPNSRSLIDVVIASNAEHIAECDVISLGISDYPLTYCVISPRPRHSAHQHRTIKTRNFKHFDEWAKVPRWSCKCTMGECGTL